MGTEYQLVVEIARRIEGYRQRDREQFQHDQRARFSGEFRGAPTGGAHGEGAMSESSYCPPAIQGSSGGYSGHYGSSSSYFSAMPESSYRPPTIQGSFGGYSGQQAQTSGRQAMVPRGCYECGDPGHMKRTCPILQGKAVQ
uniref:CCHC-type domain-containing protein n=1 Tax=Nicotiana tabacum TaxID=4097 RepID=A0A1S3YF57_TOBAC|nr:PREDICTED: uncharacterized protein LOC107775561 [Nicotiana tabacum]